MSLHVLPTHAMQRFPMVLIIHSFWGLHSSFTGCVTSNVLISLHLPFTDNTPEGVSSFPLHTHGLNAGFFLCITTKPPCPFPFTIQLHCTAMDQTPASARFPRFKLPNRKKPVVRETCSLPHLSIFHV